MKQNLREPRQTAIPEGWIWETRQEHWWGKGEGSGEWPRGQSTQLLELRAMTLALSGHGPPLKLREGYSAAKGGLGIICPSILRMAAYSNSVCRSWVWIGDKVYKHGGSRHELTHERETTRRMFELRVSAKSQQFCVYIWRFLWVPTGCLQVFGPFLFSTLVSETAPWRLSNNFLLLDC